MSDMTAAPESLRDLSWYRRLYLKVEALSVTPYAFATLLAVSVVDGSVFPIPPFVVLIPMVVAEPKKWVRFCTWGAIASLLGGAIGYLIGVLIHRGAAHFAIDLNAHIDFMGIHKTVGQLLGDNFW